MSVARYIIGDTRAVTASLPDGSVDLILTSPPFLALRSYLPADHPDKALEIGSEATPADFLDVLLDLTVEWRRVLAPHGSICIELGDTFAGSGGAGGDYGSEGMRGGQEKFKGSALADRKNKVLDGDGRRLQQGNGWPLDKSLCMIPQLYASSLSYGRNLLRPEHTIEPWRVRNVVRWCRPNPPVGALGDKFRPATSEMTIACMARDRYFDLDAVREALKPGSEKPRSYAEGSKSDQENGRARVNNSNGQMSNPADAPPLDWWEISTEPYAGSHYATWPRKLLIRPILAMCPQRVCTVCGQPSRRIVEASYVGCKSGDPYEPDNWESGAGLTHAHANKRPDERATRVAETLGWTDCGHDAWRNGVTLDPFAGSGTTLAVATGHGRDAIGIDIDARNADLARERVGLFLEVEEHTPEVAA